MSLNNDRLMQYAEASVMFSGVTSGPEAYCGESEVPGLREGVEDARRGRTQDLEAVLVLT